MGRVMAGLKRKVSSPQTDARVGEWSAYAGALVWFAVGMREVPVRAQSPMELLLGTGVVLTLSVLIVTLGQLTALNAHLRNRKTGGA